MNFISCIPTHILVHIYKFWVYLPKFSLSFCYYCCCILNSPLKLEFLIFFLCIYCSVSFGVCTYHSASVSKCVCISKAPLTTVLSLLLKTFQNISSFFFYTLHWRGILELICCCFGCQNDVSNTWALQTKSKKSSISLGISEEDWNWRSKTFCYLKVCSSTRNTLIELA